MDERDQLKKPNPLIKRGGGNKQVARTHETFVGVEVVVEPVEVQDPPVAVPVQIRHIAIAVEVAPFRTTCHQ